MLLPLHVCVTACVAAGFTCALLRALLPALLVRCCVLLCSCCGRTLSAGGGALAVTLYWLRYCLLYLCVAACCCVRAAGGLSLRVRRTLSAGACFAAGFTYVLVKQVN